MIAQPVLITTVDTFAKRLKESRQRLRLTQADLARLAGTSQGTIGNLESGLRKAPRELLPLAAALQVSPQWLLTGGGEGPDGNLGAGLEPGPALRGRVPLISWVQAGAWAGAQDPLAPGEAEAWLASPVVPVPGAFALRVRGDSMTVAGVGKSYPEGSIIFVNPERRAPVNGERVIAKLDGSDEVTFKVYKNEDGRQWLQPLNPAHLPIRDEFRVLGTVFGKWEPE